MKIRNWRLYAADNEFIVNLKILLKSILILTGGILVIMTLVAMIIIYGHNIWNLLTEVL